MKAEKSFWQKHLSKLIGFVITVALFGSIAVLRHNENQQKSQSIQPQLPEIAIGKDIKGHFHTDGAWCDGNHDQTPSQSDSKSPGLENPTDEGSHPHDLLSEEDHQKLHDDEHKKLLQKEQSLLREMARREAVRKERNQAHKEYMEFLDLSPDFLERMMSFKDLKFVLSDPSVDEILTKFPDRKSQLDFFSRFLDFQSTMKDMLNEINKRPALERRLRRDEPVFIANLNSICKLEVKVAGLLDK